MHPRDAFHACHKCRRLAPAARPFVKRVFICRLSGCQKKCALPKLFEPMIIDFLLVFPSRQCEFACPVSSFLVGDTVSSGGENVLVTKYGLLLLLGARRYRAAPYRVTPLYVTRLLS